MYFLTLDNLLRAISKIRIVHVVTENASYTLSNVVHTMNKHNTQSASSGRMR